MFATSGVDAPVREIAEKAGVGTVYRHFPQRSDLIAAVFRREIDACADAAPILAAEHEPGEALARWMQRGKSDRPRGLEYHDQHFTGTDWLGRLCQISRKILCQIIRKVTD